MRSPAPTAAPVAAPQNHVHGRVNVLGVRVSVVSPQTAVETIIGWADPRRRSSEPRYACATSVHGVIEARRDPSLRRMLNSASLVAPDGMPLVWFGRVRGQGRMQRVYGPGLMLAVCERAAPLGLRHFFYGGAEGVADELAKRMSSRFPGLAVAGTHCPPFRPLSAPELDQIANRINISRADIVWVGLSTPKQERWVAEVCGRLQAGVLVTVGAAFDFHTGRVRQAPSWVQRMGMEWAFRLTQEPRRLWRRYAFTIPQFLCLASLQIVGLRRFPAD